MTRYGTAQVAQELGIDESTVRVWGKQYEIPRTRKGVKWLYDDTSMNVLKTIMKLKNEGAGMETIRSL